MRLWPVGVLVAVGAAIYWLNPAGVLQRVGWMPPAPATQPVVRWVDANGQPAFGHPGDAPAGAIVSPVGLAAPNVVGLPKPPAERPAPRQPLHSPADPEAMPAPPAPRNLALERMADTFSSASSARK